MIDNVGNVPLQCERDVNNNFKGQKWFLGLLVVKACPVSFS